MTDTVFDITGKVTIVTEGGTGIGETSPGSSARVAPVS